MRYSADGEADDAYLLDIGARLRPLVHQVNVGGGPAFFGCSVFCFSVPSSTIYRFGGAVVDEAHLRPDLYLPFMAMDGSTPAGWRRWQAAMRRPTAWSEDICCKMAANAYRRPLLIWRLHLEDAAVPSLVLPDPDFRVQESLPWTLGIDDRTPAGAHYWAMVPPA